MEIREHVIMMMIQHDHVVQSLGNVQIEQHHEVMDIQVVEHDVLVALRDGLKIESQLQHMMLVVQLH